MGAVFHYARGRLTLLPLVEALVLVVAMVLGYELRLNDDSLPLPILHGVVFACLMLFAMTALGLYDSSVDEPFRVTVQRVLMAYIVALTMLTVLFYLMPYAKVGRGIFAIASVIGLLGVLGVRWTAHRVNAGASPGRRVLVIGEDGDAQELSATLSANNERVSSRIAAVMPLTSLVSEQVLEESAGHGAGRSNIAQLVQARGISDIVVTSRDRRDGKVPMQILLELRLKGIPVRDLVSFYEQELGLIKIDHLRTSWLVFGDGFEQSTARALVKRAFDVLASVGLLVLALPFMLLAGLGILIETGRPVLFRQIRTGEHGEPFEIMKFRSMRLDAEKDGPRWASRNDNRITPLGQFLRKSRIDELPQLINVFRGDMSFVGPRPERPFFVEQLAEKIPYYQLRHNVKPGITGWAQVRLPYGDSIEAGARKLEYDLYYVKNNSPFFDVIILLETIQVVLRGKGQ